MSNVSQVNFTLKFKRCMLGDYEVSTFRRKWEEMVAEFGLEGNQWVREMYEKRKMWATAHIRGNFFAGFRTTSRCEGLNSQIGRYLSYTRQRELEADFESIVGDLVLLTPLEDIEGFAAKVSSSNEVKCTCQRMESVGIPCEHIISLLHYLETSELPDCLILTRWTKYAKQCVEGSNGEGSRMIDTIWWNRLVGLLFDCYEMCKFAGKSVDKLNATEEVVRNHLSTLKECFDAEWSEDRNESDDNIANVGDPVRDIIRRHALKQCAVVKVGEQEFEIINIVQMMTLMVAEHLSRKGNDKKLLV
ncbi:Zinc finger, PMZ-type [Sesbania bispinosa]|nr:Zinc finger, PMZ-type [Sesbania bispinosa]